MELPVPEELKGRLTREEVVSRGWEETGVLSESIIYKRGDERVAYDLRAQKVWFHYKLNDEELRAHDFGGRV